MITKLLDRLRSYLVYRRFRSLTARGLRIGKEPSIHPTVYFDSTYCHLISIGDDCTVTRGVTILAHDAPLFRYLEVGRIGQVRILDNCFIGTNCLILPGVTIGPRSVVAAGSVVIRDIPPDTVAAGNPVKVLCSLEDFLKRHLEQLKQQGAYDADVYEKGDTLSKEFHELGRTATQKGPIYVTKLARFLNKHDSRIEGEL